MNVDDLVAIDVRAHAEVSASGDSALILKENAARLLGPRADGDA